MIQNLYVVAVADSLKCLFCAHTAEVEDALHVLGHRAAHFGVRGGIDSAAVSEAGLFCIDGLDEHGDETAYPSLAMDYLGNPTQFLDGFQHAVGIEAGTLGIGGIFVSVLVVCHLVVGEEFIVINEVNLNAGTGYACHLDDERMVCVINYQVHSAEADNFVQLVASFIDDTPFGHKGSYLATAFLGQLREFASPCRQRCFGYIGNHFLCYK